MMLRRHQPSRTVLVISYVFLFGAVVAAIFPIIWTISTSVKQKVDALSIPPKWFNFSPTFENYRTVLSSPEFRGAVRVSLVVTAAATTLTVGVAILLSYALVRMRTPGRRLLVLLLVLAQTIPVVVLVTPLFNLAVKLDLYDNIWLVTVILSALTLPFSTWVMVAFMRSIPVELEEAAFVDGARRFAVLRYVVLPLVKPGIATCAIFSAIGVWSAFLVPSVLGEKDARTLPVVIAGYISARTIDWGPLTAAASLTMLPIILFTIFAQRLLVSGLTIGGVRG